MKKATVKRFGVEYKTAKIVRVDWENNEIVIGTITADQAEKTNYPFFVAGTAADLQAAELSWLVDNGYKIDEESSYDVRW